MEKHFIDIFVPHRKLKKVYYLVSALLLLLWIPDLNKLNIPLPSKVLETWFLDKLLLTTIVLLLLYSSSTYYLSFNRAKTDKPENPEQKKDQVEQLSEMHEKILELLFDKSSTFENICRTLKLTKEEANYYLNDLMTDYRVNPPVPYSSGPELWSIDQDGREYVMKKRKHA